MTSKSLFSDKSSGRIRYTIPQKELTKRRMWVVGLTALLFSLYLIAGIAITLAQSRSAFNAGGVYGILPAETLAENLSFAAQNFYKSPFLYLLTGVAAIASGIQGFSWLHNKRAVDFYESQPVSRRKHFFGIVLNSSLIYLAVLVGTMLISLLVAAAMGAGSPDTAACAFRSLLVNACLFPACYSVAALAAVLTGNPVVSILAAGVLFLYEPVMRIVIFGLNATFFTTFPDYYSDILKGEFFFPFSHAFHEFGKGACWHNLVIGAAVILLAWFCFTKRKNESAGSAVVFRPVRVIVKIGLVLLVSLFTGLIFSIYSGRMTGLVMAVIASFVAGCVMEIIYAYNFKALFRHFLSTLIGVAAGAFILLVFMLDVFGYNAWTPKEGDLEYAAVSFSFSDNDYYHDDGSRYSTDEEYYRDYMRVTDPRIVTRLVEVCREGMEDRYGDKIDQIRVIYGMKNGAVEVRQYDVPWDIDRAIVGRLLSDPGFKEGWYPIYHSGFMDTLKGSLTLSYADESMVTAAKSGKNVDLDAFRRAYLADMERLDYEYMLDHRPLGDVIIEKETYPNLYQYYTVYEGFDHTEEFLASEGITVSNAEAWFEDVGSITVACGEYRKDYGKEGPQAEAIKKSVLPRTFCSIPFRNYLESGEGFLVLTDGEESSGLCFIEGRIPAFVREDYLKN